MSHILHLNKNLRELKDSMEEGSYPKISTQKIYGLKGGERMSKVEWVKNMLILSQFYSTLRPSSSIQMETT